MQYDQGPMCVICSAPTDQTCLWCNMPLHRHHGQDDMTGDIERTHCWMQHQFCTVKVKRGVRRGHRSHTRRQSVFLSPSHVYSGGNR